MKRVVVTGIGAITPIGRNIEQYWEGLKSGTSGSDWISRFDAEKFKTRFACEVKGYDPLDYFDRKEARKLDLYAQFALISADEAVKDSGLNVESLDKDQSGVIWGSGIGGIETFLNEITGFVTGGEVPRFSPFFIPKMISDIAAGHISIKYGFQGPNYSTVSACASATHAIIDSTNLIRLGKAKVFITGGSEAAINKAGIGGFNAMQAMSTNNEAYKTASKPMDLNRDGFVMGEGGGALILEEYEHAVARGARIYGEICGTGMTGDAYHITAPHPDGIGAYKVMKLALEESGLRKEDIDYINVHGTATPLGDISETKAIVNLFGEHAYNMSISATKSMTGHLLGAAGAIEAIAAILAMENDIVPPTINHSVPDPGIDQKLNLTLNKAQKRKISSIISNTFGFGGHNASVVIKQI